MPDTYINLNSQLNLYGPDRKIQFDKDKAAARAYFLEHVNQNTVFHHDLAEKLEYLTREGYYETEFLDKYEFTFIKNLFKQAYAHKFRFRTFVGAYKFYRQYALKTWDGKRYLERYEDRITIVALYLADGDKQFAKDLVEEMITGRFQPATPTFLNAGRKQRGELVSCDLIEVADDMNSIGRAVNSLLQLSKRGAGVALNLTNLRSTGDPIKGLEGQASGVVPVMKILEDCIKYANQLGQRDGSAAVYLNIFHKDIEVFLDSRRENADDAIRINKLSLGVVIPDVFFELVKNNEDMYLFSPYDVSRKYGKDFAEVNVTEVYRELVDDNSIKKKKVRARTLFSRLAETQVESGYPYVMFEDNVNNQNPIAGKIKMSNLCSEILQVQTASVVRDNQTYEVLGKDISCNLASLNIDKVMEGGNIKKTVYSAIKALSEVSDKSDVSSVPTIENGNNKSHAVGIGAMNLHGFLAKHGIEYGSDDALYFVDRYFETITFYALSASMDLARKRKQTFEGFKESDYASGVFFDKYIGQEKQTNEKIDALFSTTELDWNNLKSHVMRFGIYNQNLQAVAPTGSISYINDSTASILPVTAKIETRKEGTMGQVYWPAPNMTDENVDLYKDGYEVGWKAIIDTYAAAQKHVDQGMSCTLFFEQDATTREINKAQIYAWKKGLKTLYYVRLRMNVMDGLDDQSCVSCAV